MNKRISTIAIIAAVFATTCGALFVGVDAAIYEWLNGPPLVSESCIDIFNGGDFHYDSGDLLIVGSHGYMIQINTPSREVPDLEKITTVYKFGSNLYRAEEFFTPLQEIEVSMETRVKCMNSAKYSNNTVLEINRLLDKRHFPDPNTRSDKKRELHKRLNANQHQLYLPF